MLISTNIAAGLETNLGIPSAVRRLVQQLKYANESSLSEAILIAPRGGADDLDDRGLAGDLIDQVAGRAGVQPAAVRYLPCGRIAIVKAPARFIRAALEMGSFSVASAVSGAAYEG